MGNSDHIPEFFNMPKNSTIDVKAVKVVKSYSYYKLRMAAMLSILLNRGDWYTLISISKIRHFFKTSLILEPVNMA